MLSPEVVEGSGFASGDHHFGDRGAGGGEVVGVGGALGENGAGVADGDGVGDAAAVFSAWEAAGFGAGDNHHLDVTAAGGEVVPGHHTSLSCGRFCGRVDRSTRPPALARIA